MRLRGTSRPSTSRVEVSVTCHDAKTQRLRIFKLGTFDIDGDSSLGFRPADFPMRVRTSDRISDLARDVRFRPLPGDELETDHAFCRNDVRPTFQIAHTSGKSLVGPAWVMGRREIVYEPQPYLPWVALLASALSAQRKAQDAVLIGPRLTLDEQLQSESQHFVANLGAAHHSDVIEYLICKEGGFRGEKCKKRMSRQTNMESITRPYQKMPPRVGLVMLQVPSGDVLAIAGWPRSAAGDSWQETSDDVLPPLSWLENHAPPIVARLYESDRNFDRLVVGSASKPLWAAAGLSVNPDLAQRLHVRGTGEKTEDKIFGLQIVGPREAWEVHEDENWCDFHCYLSKSDNRYQILYNFLALAGYSDDGSPQDAHVPVEAGRTNSTTESMQLSPHEISRSLDGKDQDYWQRFPRFPDEVAFSQNTPRRLLNLDKQELARKLRDLFGIYITLSQVVEHRNSFWTGSEDDDLPQNLTQPPFSRLSPLFHAISPVATNLALDRIESPRDFISVLLGGLTNRWANVELAASFGTAVTGIPIVPHITILSSPAEPKRIGDFGRISRSLRGPLAEVVERGTAKGFLEPTRAWLVRRGYRIYAKTGTLRYETGADETQNMSRIVVAIVRWNRTQTKIQNGIVMALFVERAPEEFATKQLNEFIQTHTTMLESRLP